MLNHQGQSTTPALEEIPEATIPHRNVDGWEIYKEALSVDELLIVKRMQEIAKNPERQRVPALKNIPRRTVLREVREVNAILEKIITRSVTHQTTCYMQLQW